ncbi:MAG: TIGR01777 family oxidoreductase [Deltaproteobacteria bacterium]|jgi:uncharacterized protein (TIGR01777 family)|nr:TIGR01777 family oxidoreductase [Deltaproteobacteria bacterium]
MRVFITGATGFVGQELAKQLMEEKHQIVAWVRNRQSARELLGPSVELVPTSEGDAKLVEVLSRVDAVVNLAGANLFVKRWSRAYKETLVSSRVETTSRIVDAMIVARRPKVLVSASGVGFYGDRGDEILNESSRSGDDFLAQLSRRWEEAAGRAEQAGIRVVQLRIGTVLGQGGGALGRLVPLFRRGLGGRLGPGTQYMSWIHISDLVQVIRAAAVDERYRGPINAVAPEQVSNAAFTQALAGALGRRAMAPAPSAVLRAAVGPAATCLLASQRAVPRRLEQLGFRFRFATLEEALDVTLRHERGRAARWTRNAPDVYQDCRSDAGR